VQNYSVKVKMDKPHLLLTFIQIAIAMAKFAIFDLGLTAFVISFQMIDVSILNKCDFIMTKMTNVMSLK